MIRKGMSFKKSVLITALILIGLLMVTSTVFAHHPEVSGSVVCANGNYQITWTVGNSESAAGRIMTIVSASRGSGYASTVAPSGATSGTETVSGTTTGMLTNTVVASWFYDANAPKNVSRTGSVTLGGDCEPEETDEPTVVPSETPLTPTDEPESTTPSPTQTDNPPDMNGGHICWFMQGGGPNDNPFGGQPWGVWVDTGEPFGGYIIVSYKDIPASDPTGPRTGWEISLQTDDDSRREGVMTITGPNGFSVTGDVSQNLCNFPWNTPNGEPTPRPIPASGGSDLPAGRGSSNNTLPLLGAVVILAAMAFAGNKYIRRRQVA